MTRIAFLGMGAMGSRMASHILKAGYELVVWNRTASGTAPLVKAGAKSAATPKDAAQGSAFVISMVRDNEASRQVWLDPTTGALAGMTNGAVAVESSTLTPEWIRSLAQTIEAKGISFLEAPVSGSRPQADAAQLVFLVGGKDEVFAKTKALLSTMGPLVHHVGPAGAGAVAKLATNTLMGIQVTAIAELLGLFQRTGVDTDQMLNALSTTAVWSPMLARSVPLMLSGNYAPLFPVELIEKDFGYAIAASGDEASLPIVAAARGVFRKAMEKGMGSENMTGVVRLYRK